MMLNGSSSDGVWSGASVAGSPSQSSKASQPSAWKSRLMRVS